MGYTEPGVYSKKDLSGNPVVGGGNLVIGIIGETYGTPTSVAHTITREATAIDVIGLEHVLSVHSIYQDVGNSTIINFKENIDYKKVANENKIEWLNKQVTMPEIQTVTCYNAANEEIQSGEYTEYKIGVQSFNATGATTICWKSFNLYTTPATANIIVTWAGTGSVKYAICKCNINDTDPKMIEVAASIAKGTTTFTIPIVEFNKSGVATKVVVHCYNRPDSIVPNLFTAENYVATVVYSSFVGVHNAPKYYYTKDCVEAICGTDSPLTVAAGLAFDNGAQQVLIVAVENTAYGSYVDAIDSIAGKECNTLICLSTSEAVKEKLISFVNAQSSYENRNEMCAMIGAKVKADVGDSDTLGSMIDIAEQIQNKRVTYVGNWCTINNTDYDGNYIACAIAGKRCGVNDLSKSLTREMIVGLGELKVVSSRPEMNTMAESGIMVIAENGGVNRIRHDITTDTKVLENSENCIVYTDDALIKGLRTSLETFIGAKINNGLVTSIILNIKKYLSYYVDAAYIVSYTGLRVTQDTNKMTRILVYFKYQPSYPCNEIEIRFGFDLV